ncbi:MATE family efflux transporter [Treponema sp. OttesenSCG-928-L16]|nr:MATE family efflux transporter [Treponema sp. OttesenSCG-928-L16]
MTLEANRKTILSYVLPSICAMIVSFTYNVVDGIFVGRGVGPNALGAVNLAVPFTEIMTALASMLTIGGGTVMAIRKGRGEYEKANQAFMASIFLLSLVAAALTFIGAVFPCQVARAFGATELLLEDTAVYIRWYFLFAIFFTISILGCTFVRNDGSPGLAFWGMVSGAAANIFLDWLFIFPLGMGIKGAAIASGLGQIIACLVLATHFIRKKGILRFRRFRPEGELCRKVAVRGLPEFVVQLSQPVTIFCYNQVILRLSGESGLAAFSAISYLITIMMGLFFGISQGLQPLIGNSYGAGNRSHVRYFFRSGLKINLACSTLLYLVYFFLGDKALSLFLDNPVLVQSAQASLKVYGLAFIIASVSIIYMTYFLSTKRTAQALVISGARGFVLNSLLIFTLPVLLGPSWLWYPAIISEVLTMLIAIGLKRHYDTAERLEPAGSPRSLQ